MILVKIAKPDAKPILNTIIIPTKYITSTATPAEPTAGSSIALCLTSLLPFAINPSAKSAKASVWWTPVIITKAPVTKNPMSRGCKKLEMPSAIAPIIEPITKPASGNRYMFLAM